MWILVLVCFLVVVTKSCPNLCNPIKCSTIGSPVLHYLPEFVQIHVLSQWWYPTISSSVIPFSCLQFSPASGSFPMSQFFFISGGQIIGASASASVLPMNWKCWFPLIDWFYPLAVKGNLKHLLQCHCLKHQCFSTQPSLWSNSHICT